MGRKCKNSNVPCGTILSSNCVDYIGQDLKSLDKEVDQCDQNVSEVIEKLDSELKKLKDSLDVKKITKLCINSIDKEDTIVLIINKLINEICDLNKQVDDLKSNYETIDILSQVVNLDSSCLSSTHCSTDSTLKSLLMKIISELCLVKSQVNNSSNSSNIYQP